jgi:YegS/Rv2252/BmrU family lipid kinase
VSVIAIINPVSGTGADPTVASRRVAMLRDAATRRGIDVEIHLTERAGHARDLATAAVRSGAPLVIAWGGDGTINEVGAALIRTATVLGVVPAGSGNGLAAALAVPRDPAVAVAAAFDGSTSTIDAGMMAGRPFFNIGGVGFDAHIARLFNQRSPGSRGGWPYVTIGVREGCRYTALDYRVSFDDHPRTVRALLIAFANGREYGLGARIAPQAQLDDGVLDATVVEDRSVIARFLDAPYLAFAAAHRARGVTVSQIRKATIEADGPIAFHVDGEAGIVERRLEVQVVPAALRVRVPRAASASG